MSIKEIITNHYKDRVSPEKKSFDILDWGSEEEQFTRFNVLINHIKTLEFSENFSLLDVGCGLGDLKRLLDSEFDAITYVGSDLTFEIAQEAVRRQSDLKLICSDLNDSFPFRSNSFDIVFASGVFNLRLNNHEEFIKNAISNMIDVSKAGILVNFLHKRIDKQYDYCYYTSPEHILELTQPFSHTATVIDDYLEKDFSIWFSK